MNILTTVFLRFDNLKLVFPNSVLSATPIGNFYRSPDMGDAIDFLIHVATPVEKIALMKQRIVRYTWMETTISILKLFFIHIHRFCFVLLQLHLEPEGTLVF